jgi:P4 family phage/plasmid primase-like protien
MKPKTLPVLFQNIPLGLRSVPRWTLWNYVLIGEEDTQRWSKLPVQPTGKAASSTNPTTWTDFLSAEAAYLTGRFDGIGFVFTGDDHIIGVDLDDCYDDATNQFINDELKAIADGIEGYMEISPSGTGVKIFTLADLHASHVDHDKGLEIYPKGRYFTVTGHKISGELPANLQDITHLIPERTVRSSGDAFADYNPPLEGWDMARVEAELLPQFDPHCGYTDWLQMGMCLHHQFQGDLEACEMWDRWSYGDGSVVNYTTNACENKWKTFNQKGGGATLRTLTFKISQNNRNNALAKGDLILGVAPMENAQTFLDSRFSCEEGIKLVHYSADFYAYKGTHYADVEESTVRSDLYKFLDKCKKQDRKGNIVPFAPNPASVSAAMDATKALVHLENHANTRPPVWLNGYSANRPEANKLVSLKNGLFHLEDNILLPHSLGFFTQNSLPFSYDPLADCPQWNQFLNDVWSDDQESIDCLQEMFGYILSGDTMQQKFFNIIGPRRSGKGTINKVLVELLGQHNTVAPELGELCDTFGLQPWLGKLLASFTDARAPDRDRGAVVSQLLRIVGGDTVTINRKNKEAWNGYLPTRIVIYSNEVLQLTESSNALTGRMIVLKMNKSFYGKEDTALSSKLMGELSGIFNWAMVGLHRRLERGGYFTQPQTGKELLETMEEMSNPIGSFIEDALEYEKDAGVDKDEVFMCYKRWAIRHGLTPGNDLSFKRRFLAATQDKGVSSVSTRIEGKRQHRYSGIKLNEKAQAFIDKQTLFDEEESSF